MSGDEDVESLLREIQAQKQKELRARAEKEKIRTELNLHGVPALVLHRSEKQETLRHLSRQRAEYAQQEKERHDMLDQLSQSLSRKEHDFRRAHAVKDPKHLFQNAADSAPVIARDCLKLNNSFRCETETEAVGSDSVQATQVAAFDGELAQDSASITNTANEKHILDDQHRSKAESAISAITIQYQTKRIEKLKDILSRTTHQLPDEIQMSARPTNTRAEMDAIDELQHDLKEKLNYTKEAKSNVQRSSETSAHQVKHVEEDVDHGSNAHWNIYESRFAPNPSHWSTPQLHPSSFLPQEQELMRVHNDLETMKLLEEQHWIEKENTRLQDILATFQNNQITLNSGNVRNPKHDSMCQEDEEDLAISRLKKLHLQELLRLRHERDLIEEQEKLDETRDAVQRRQEEKRQRKEHDEWMVQQKRLLVSKRMQTLACPDNCSIRDDQKMTMLDSIDGEQAYSFTNGICVFWDFVMGLPVSVEGAHLTFALFEGNLLRSSFKKVQAKSCDLCAPGIKRCMLWSRQNFPLLTASTELKLIVEVSSFVPGCAGTETSLGWSVVNLFGVGVDGMPTLRAGYHKVNLCSTPMPDPCSTQLPNAILEESVSQLALRIVHGSVGDQAGSMNLNPESHSHLYKAMADRNRTARESHPIQGDRPKSHSRVFEKSDLRSSMSTARSRFSPLTPQISVPFSAASMAKSAKQHESDLVSVVPTTSDRKEVTACMRYSNQCPSSTAARPSTSIRTLAIVPEGQWARDEVDSTSWISVDKFADRQQRLTHEFSFVQGDCFDVFVDVARSLPDSATMSKCTVFGIHSDRSQVSCEQSHGLAVLSSDAFNPVYRMWAEFREKYYNPTLTVVIRLDTIEAHTKKLVVVGYALLPAFLDLETSEQPRRPSVQQFALNEGGYQLPIFPDIPLGSTASDDFTAKLMDNLPRLPCATLLIRVKQAKKTESGLHPLSRRDIPEQEWLSRGLTDALPDYFTSNVYDTLSSTPSAIEQKIYRIRVDRQHRPVRETLREILPAERLTNDDDNEPIDAFFHSTPKASLDLRYAYRFSSEIGFRLAIDCVHNVKMKNAFFKVVYSVSPPAAFYQETRLTGDVHFTTSMDWSSAQTSPEFQDGFLTLRDVKPVSDGILVVILDVRAMTKSSKTGMWTIQQYGWSFLPFLTEQATVASGCYQLPLLQGHVRPDVVQTNSSVNLLVAGLETDNKKSKSQALKYVDGASVFVRIEDPQLPFCSCSPLSQPIHTRLMSRQAAPRCLYDAGKVALLRKKSPMSKLLPPNSSVKQLEKELNQVFAQELGILHYSF